MDIRLNLGENSYTVRVERDSLKRAGELFNLDRKVLIVTDEGVPVNYSMTIKSQCKEGYIVTLPQGEGTKSFKYLEMLLKIMTQKAFSRKDCVVAVGGGVIGDLCGFCASCYMRGVDFYNVPTTTLSQIDSSIGGKCAINFEGIKNIVGAFYQPKAVLVDSKVLDTLDKRQTVSGLCEAVKMAATFDEELFSLFEKGDYKDRIDDIIFSSLILKKNVVEQDEKETGLRKVLNFGHTIGHGIEAFFKGKYYHGECVSMGMMYMCSPRVKARLEKVLLSLSLPVKENVDWDEICDIVAHDKKVNQNGIDVVWVDEIGTFEIKTLTLDEIKNLSKEV